MAKKKPTKSYFERLQSNALKSDSAAVRSLYGQLGAKTKGKNTDKYGFPKYTALTTLGKGPERSSLKKSLLNVGSNTVKALSIPQAALATGLTNYAALMNKVGGGEYKFQPWDLAYKGAFSDRYKGFAPFTSQVFRDDLPSPVRKGLNITLDVVVDPLWLTGFAGGVAKGAKGAGKLAELGAIAKAASEGRKIVAEADKAVSAAFGKGGGKAALRERQLQDAHLMKEGGRLKAEVEKAFIMNKAQGIQPTLRIGIGQKKIKYEGVEIMVPRGLEIPLTPRFLKRDPEELLSKLKDGAFRRSPAGKAVDSLKMLAEQHVDEFDKVVKDLHAASGLNDSQAFLVGTAAQIRASGGRHWEVFKASWGDLWTKEMDDMVEHFEPLFNQLAKMNGMTPHRVQAERARAILNNVLDNYKKKERVRLQGQIDDVQEELTKTEQRLLQHAENKQMVMHNVDVYSAEFAELEKFRNATVALSKRVEEAEAEVARLQATAKGKGTRGPVTRAENRAKALREELKQARERLKGESSQASLRGEQEALNGLIRETRAFNARKGKRLTADEKSEAADLLAAVRARLKKIGEAEVAMERVAQIMDTELPKAREALKLAKANRMLRRDGAKKAIKEAEDLIKSLENEMMALQRERWKSLERMEFSKEQIANLAHQIEDFPKYLTEDMVQGIRKNLERLKRDYEKLDEIDPQFSEEVNVQLFNDAMRQIRSASSPNDELFEGGLSEFTRTASAVHWKQDGKGRWIWNEEAAKKDGVGVPQSWQELRSKIEFLENRDSYVPLLMDAEARHQLSQSAAELVSAGKISGVRDIRYSAGDIKFEGSRTYENAFKVMTRDRFVEQATKKGLKREEANAIADDLDRVFGFSEDPHVFKAWSEDGIEFIPDLDYRAMMTGRATAGMRARVEAETHQLIREIAGEPSDWAKMWDDLSKVQNPSDRMTFKKWMTSIPGVGDDLIGKSIPMTATAWLKAWFTVMNPGHYVANGAGQIVNNWLESGWYQALRGGVRGMAPSGLGGKNVRLLADAGFKFDRKAQLLTDGTSTERLLKMKVKVGEQEMTGLEAHFAMRMSGLGTSRTQEEINQFLNLASTRHPLTITRNAMNKFNMNRENATRVAAWIGHMQKGHDMFTAGVKVVRTHFDYASLTEFEKIWMRNTLLFYTWFKKNLVLQSQGILMKPGMYAAMDKIERARPKWENEPAYLSKTGAIGTPLGMVSFSNPMAEIYRWYDLAGHDRQDTALVEPFRSNVLGSLNPWLKVPIELATNQNFFTGGEIERFDGANTPHWSAPFLNAVGFGTPSRKTAADESPQAAIPARWAHLISSVQGPQGGILASLSDDTTKSPRLKALGALTGARMTIPDEEKWRRTAELLEANEKANATRKRNYERP